MAATLSSKRYAQAVFEIAKEQNKLEEWQDDLNKVAGLMREAEIVSFMENPKVPFEDKAKLVREALRNMNPLTINLTCLLILKGRVGNAEQIASEYARILDDYRGVKHAVIVTAIHIDDSTKKMLSQRLETMVGKKISVGLQVDPNVLGGFVAKIEDKLFDFSIRNKLNLLKKDLVEMRR